MPHMLFQPILTVGQGDRLGGELFLLHCVIYSQELDPPITTVARSRSPPI
jgi:hypothetical protein